MDTRTVRVPAESLRRGPGAHDLHTAVFDAAGVPPATPVVCAHGLGGSHLNWGLLGPSLAATPGLGPVWAPDLAGFGLTGLRAVEGSERRATVDDNADLLAGFIATASPGTPVLLIGNSMGGLLSLRVAATRPELVAALVLVNPAVPAPVGARLDAQVAANFALLALPKVGERLLSRRQRRLTPLQQARETMTLCCADPAAVDAALLDAHADLAARRRAMPHANRAFLQAARDVVRTLTIGRNRIWDDVARVRAPALYLQGTLDRVVHPGAGALLVRHRPDWEHVRYEDLGHIPMVEDPARVADDIAGWLARTPMDHAT